MDHGIRVEAQSFFVFERTAWTKVGTLSLAQLITARKFLNSDVRATGIDS